jgi:uncharacterized damage-inducible protein DinB
MLLNLPFRGNCFNWVLGHIATNRDQVLNLLGQQPIFTQAEVDRYKTGSAPVLDGETAVHSDKLLAAIQESQIRIEAGLNTVSAEKLAEIFNEEHNQTVADRIAGLHWHETYHTGQLELLRQLAGTDDRILG